MILKDPSLVNKLSFRQIQSLVQDLKQPNPTIYWCDFLGSIIAGHILFHLMMFADQIWPGQTGTTWFVRCLTYPVTVLLYLRAVMFIHELVHLPAEGFGMFRFAWNLLCGVFFLVPSFMYYPHVDHHRRKTYATDQDGEYLALSHRPTWYIVGFLLQNLVIPFAGLLRFGIVSPMVWLIPRLRPWVHRHLSTMVVDPFYERHDESAKVIRIVIIQEVACFLWCVLLIGRGLVTYGTWNNPLWLTAYAVSVGVLTINGLRTLGAHRWTIEGESCSFEDQVLDSLNYPDRPWITELWGPVGTRYHGLHHLLPSLPYHNLGVAHRRLMEHLPADSIYRETVKVGLLEEIRALWLRARESSAVRAAG